MKEIQAQARTVRDLLGGRRYKLDYYQREYKWEERQVRELVEDLADTFLEDFDPSDGRQSVKRYGHYFLGSLIVSRRDTDTFIIDGQQRLTTLTLLLIYLHRRLGSGAGAVLDDLIFAERFGDKSFNVDVEERRDVMEALYSGEPYEDQAGLESVENIQARFDDIGELFPSDLDEHALPYFADWLIENVHLVEITAISEEDAYLIFETMNDRGLSLAPLDMLKGWVLANITVEEQRRDANQRWKRRVRELQELGKEEDADAVKAWLRAQHAQTIREHRRGAHPGDFDRLGTDFHRWVREHETELGLLASTEFYSFVKDDLDFYSRQYERLREASVVLTPGLEMVYYNAQQQFTLQYPLLLAPLVRGDDPQTTERKIRVCAAYVDVTLADRRWNSKSIAYNTMVNAIFNVMLDIRRKPLDELLAGLARRLEAELQGFDANQRMHLDGHNRPTVRYLLARLTDFVERESGLPGRFAEYVATGRNSHDVEHIWADKFDRHTDEFEHEQDFNDYRNRIGGLLLLPKSFNRSFGDLTYGEKLPHYLEQNTLAKSLHPQAYERNPGFVRFNNTSGLAFGPHEAFGKEDLDARQDLYTRLAKKIWSADRLMEAVT